jgi:hypothetical protein
VGREASSSRIDSCLARALLHLSRTSSFYGSGLHACRRFLLTWFYFTAAFYQHLLFNILLRIQAGFFGRRNNSPTQFACFEPFTNEIWSQVLQFTLAAQPLAMSVQLVFDLLKEQNECTCFTVPFPVSHAEI